MRLASLAVLALLAGCAPKPADLLKSALAHASTTPHTFSGRAARTIPSPSSSGNPFIVKWEVKGSFAAPYESVELKAEAGPSRSSIGREGWWVEPYEGAWRAYPPPHESIEWLDPGAFQTGEDYGPDQTVGGVDCRRIFASYPAGRMTFDVSKKDGRILRVSGGATDGQDIYEFELTFDWSGAKVEPPEGAKLVLDALRGQRTTGDDPLAREAITRAWSVLPRETSKATATRITFVNASEVDRSTLYLEQEPPIRVWNRTSGKNQIFLFTDGKRTVKTESLSVAPTELDTPPPSGMDEMADMTVKRAAYLGDSEMQGVKCRLIGADLKSRSSPEDVPATAAWFWISAEGRLLRQLLVAKANMSGEGTREVTTCADITIRSDPPADQMPLLKHAREFLHR